MIAVVACAMGAISFVGAFIGGAVGLKDASPIAIMLIWLFLVLAFVFFWTIALTEGRKRVAPASGEATLREVLELG